MSDSTYGAFEELTKDNYETWRIHAEALLVESDLWDYVEKGKKFISKDVGRRELSMKQDKIAKSQLILHISSSLLPLVENCTTSREVWLKLANVYGNKVQEHEGSIEHSDTNDVDEIINDIEISVDDFFETINDLSEKKIIKDKKSLSTNFTDNLFLQLKINGIKKLPDKTIIINTVSDFIDVIGELSKLMINEHKNKLSGELMDSLLVKFNINPYQNGNDETKSEADTTQTRESDTAAGEKKENNQVSSGLIAAHYTATNLSDMIHEDEMTIVDEPILNDFSSKLQPQFHHDRILWKSYGQEEHENSMNPLASLYTPPSTPTLKIARKCGVCRKEGHNRTTCPFNKSVAYASKYTAATPRIPEVSSSRSTVTNPGTHKRSNKCGVCRGEGHNRRTCPFNKPVASASKYTTATPGIPKISSSRSTPKRSYKCGVCREEGHNRTSCPLTKPAAPESRYYTVVPETPKRSYKCGGCGNEGHNIRSCPRMNSETSSPMPAAVRTAPARSYTCGSCGEKGHSKTTCPRNYVTSKAPIRAAHRCGNCGGEGHNNRTCSRRETSSSSYYAAPSCSYSSPAPSSGGGRSHRRRLRGEFQGLLRTGVARK